MTNDPVDRRAIIVGAVGLALIAIGTVGKLLCMAGIIHVWCT